MTRTLTAAAALLLAAGTAHAHIIFTVGNHPQANEQNILFEAAENGTALDHGEVDHSGAGVTFDSKTGQLLQQTAEGQADIFCFSGCINNSPPPGTSSQLNSIEMKAGLNAQGQPTAWTDAIINLDFGEGTALVTAIDNLNQTFSYVLGNGQNFLTMVADPLTNEVITDITVIHDPSAPAGESFGFNSFKQPRVSGVCTLVGETCTPIPTPEPASLALLSTGLLGATLAIRRRRR